MDAPNPKSVKDLRSIFENNIQKQNSYDRDPNRISETEKQKRDSISVKKIQSPFLVQ